MALLISFEHKYRIRYGNEKNIFERRLIEKYIKEEGKCPVTGMELSDIDLITVQGIIYTYFFLYHLF